jgi:hypothetical protein
MDKPQFWLKALKPVFGDLGGKFPLNVKIKKSAVQLRKVAFRLIPLSTPVSFFWTVPFIVGLYFLYL